jgi:hypothetical protein
MPVPPRQLLPEITRVFARLIFLGEDKPNSYRLADVDGAITEITSCVASACTLLTDGSALPGPDAEESWNEFRLALPAAPATYFEFTAPGREDRHHVVLVVEDEILMCSVTAESLRIAGYNVVEAANAAEAVAVFTAGTVIDLVFSDINFMAGPNSMDAVGLARWVSRPGKMAAI